MNRFSIHTFFLISLLCLCFQAFSQNRASTVFFGDVGLDFRFSTPQPIYPINMLSRESSTSICDENGDILFYTNGGNSPSAPGIEGAVWNYNHDIMDNGILGNFMGCISSAQGAIIVPFPADDQKTTEDLYYLFMKDCLESSFTFPNYNSGLSYAVIDMAENNGEGKVISKDNIIEPYSIVSVNSTAYEPVSAIQHGNDNDYWLFSYTNDSLYRIKVDANGIGTKHMMFPSEGGRITFAPNREHVCVGNYIYEFDANTGDMTYVDSLPGSTYAYAAFSPDGTKLYHNNGGAISQYDLNQSNFMNSGVQLAFYNTIYRMWLAPDHRIYFTWGDAYHFEAQIRCPNEAGTNCGFSTQDLSLGGGRTYHGYPNLMAHYLYYSGNCVASLDEPNSLSEEKVPIKIVNALGQETIPAPNQLLIYIYEDGSTRKVVLSE